MRRADVEAALKAARVRLAEAEACPWFTVPPTNRSRIVVRRECRREVAELERTLARMPAPKKAKKTPEEKE